MPQMHVYTAQPYIPPSHVVNASIAVYSGLTWDCNKGPELVWSQKDKCLGVCCIQLQFKLCLWFIACGLRSSYGGAVVKYCNTFPSSF